MKNRGLVLAVVAVASLLCGLALLTLRDSQASAAEIQRNEVEAVAPPTSPLDPVAPLETPRESESRRATDVQPTREPLDEGESNVETNAVANGEVVVEVRVMTPDEEAPLSPHPYAGGVVHTQSWDDDTEATHAHHASIDADGVARFRFPGEVHLDWFRAEVPAGAGVAPAFEEFHENIPAGAVYRVAIRTHVGGRVFGRVATASGVPLGGVEVSAYLNNDGQHGEWADDWYPGHFTTTSGAGGAFEFAALPAGDISVVVRPGEWLQVCPIDGVESFELEEGAVHDAGVLQLARRSTLVVRVVDREGKPAKHAPVALEPIAFDERGIVTESEWELRFDPARRIEDDGVELDEAEQQRWIEAAEAAARTTPIWYEYNSSWNTDENGVARCNVVEGTWDIVVRPQLGADYDEVRRRVRVPSADVVLELGYSLVDIAGSVVDEVTGKPVGGVGVELRVGAQRTQAGSDREGRFRFESLRLSSAYSLAAQRGGYFPTSASFAANELSPALTIREAARLRIRLRDASGAEVRPGNLRLVSARLDSDVAFDSRALAWLARPEPSLGIAQVSRSSEIAFTQLWPGQYEATYSIRTTTGELGEWGEPLDREVVVGTWSLHTDTKLQDVFFDGASLPPPSSVRYAKFRAFARDAQSRELVPNAEFEIVHPLRTRTFSSDNGVVQCEIPSGDIKLSIRHPDYEPLEGVELKADRRPIFREWLLHRR